MRDIMYTDDIFIYHLDGELIKLYISPSRYRMTEVKVELDRILRVAFLLCKKRLLIPISSFFESDIAFHSILSFEPLIKYNVIHLISTSGNLKLLLEKKQREHGDNISSSQFHYIDFLKHDSGIYLPGTLSKRQRSSSKDIMSSWLSSIGNMDIWAPYFEQIDYSDRYTSFENKLARIPERLGERAYISDYVTPLLEMGEEREELTNRFVNVFITREYIASFLKEFPNATALCDIPYINSSEILPKNLGRDYISYSELVTRLHQLQYKGQSALQYISFCSMDELYAFKYSKQWEEMVARVYQNTTTNHQESGGDTLMKTKDNITIGLITALPEEFIALKVLLNDVDDYQADMPTRSVGERYYTGTVECTNGKKHHVALCLLPEYANTMAGIIATKMKASFPTIDSIIMVGIAGGIPTKEHLGDVVVSTDGVIQYDLGKNEEEQFIEKDKGSPCSLSLREAVRYMQALEYETGPLWINNLETIKSSLPSAFSKPKCQNECCQIFSDEKKEYVQTIRPLSDSPKVHYGKIGSANCVQKNPYRRDRLYREHSVLAIEMEAAGVKDSARVNDIGYLVVRGICDFCDGEKNDDCHEYAAAVAASYIIGLLQSIPA